VLLPVALLQDVLSLALAPGDLVVIRVDVALAHADIVMHHSRHVRAGENRGCLALAPQGAPDRPSRDRGGALATDYRVTRGSKFSMSQASDRRSSMTTTRDLPSGVA
jgi:hypothetical protein